jgi:glyoxylase-like metal-dependent hydrolase (beta-lactamase superfamily II)
VTDSVLNHATEQVSNAQRNIPQLKAFFDKETFTVTYVVHDPDTKAAAVIDSVFNFDPSSGRTSFDSADKVIAYVNEQDLKIEWLLETHAHADHLSAATYLQENLGGKIAIGEHIVTVQDVFGKLFNSGTEFQRDGSDFDHLFADGDTFKLGSLDVTVLHVPGHTPADIAYVIGDAVFIGDTMFMPDYGSARADFPGGDARKLYQSMRRLLSLPGSTRLFMCHDYLPEGRDKYLWETTVEEQRKGNIHAHDGVSEDEFVKMRTERDKTLNMPRLILPSVQVNMRAGHLPPAEENGLRYLKVPLDGI